MYIKIILVNLHALYSVNSVPTFYQIKTKGHSTLNPQSNTLNVESVCLFLKKSMLLVIQGPDTIIIQRKHYLLHIKTINKLSNIMTHFLASTSGGIL